MENDTLYNAVDEGETYPVRWDGADWVEIRSYCTQNDGDCETCPLATNGRDCADNPL